PSARATTSRRPSGKTASRSRAPATPTRRVERRLFVLGAGASYAAGLPDADSLASQLFGYIGNAPWERVRNRPPYAYFAPLNAVLRTAMRDLQSVDGPQSRWAIAGIFDRFGE